MDYIDNRFIRVFREGYTFSILNQRDDKVIYVNADRYNLLVSNFKVESDEDGNWLNCESVVPVPSDVAYNACGLETTILKKEDLTPW